VTPVTPRRWQPPDQIKCGMQDMQSAHVRWRTACGLRRGGARGVEVQLHTHEPPHLGQRGVDRVCAAQQRSAPPTCMPSISRRVATGASPALAARPHAGSTERCADRSAPRQRGPGRSCPGRTGEGEVVDDALPPVVLVPVARLLPPELNEAGTLKGHAPARMHACLHRPHASPLLSCERARARPAARRGQRRRHRSTF
jgi:hypothetical protein